MARKLTLIVTCTDRKSVAPDESLQVRNLAGDSLEERSHTWRSTVTATTARTPLRRLYQGDAWTQALRLEASARRSGFDATLLVASAGLGLVSVDEEWPAYAATFSLGHADTVGNDSQTKRAWWAHITQGQKKLSEQAKSQTVLVLSETYSSAMAADLASLKDRDDVVVFGGSKHVPDEQRFPADRSLRSALGGTAGSLNVRTAIAWLDKLGSAKMLSPQDPEWLAWVKGARQPENYARTPLTDSAVLSFIRDLRCEQPAISKTKALRLLRENGLACEQKRFGGLFAVAMKEGGL